MNEIELMKECRALIDAFRRSGLPYADTVVKLDAYIASGGWMQVEDGLPEEGAVVLIGGYASNEEPYETDAMYRGGEWFLFDPVADQYCFKCKSPAVWRELPPLPTRE